MTRRNIRRAKAKQDILDIADHIAADNLDAALRFIDAAESAIEFLFGHPMVGIARPNIDPQIPDLRIWPIRGFENFLVIYTVSDRETETLRVIHAARDLTAAIQDE